MPEIQRGIAWLYLRQRVGGATICFGEGVLAA